MIEGLPEDTVFEARARSRRALIPLMIALSGIYFLSFNLLCFGTMVFLDLRLLFLMEGYFWDINMALVPVSIGVAWFHFNRSRNRTLAELLKRFRATRFDPDDEYHKRFANIVREVEVATGLRPIYPVVISSFGCNAFSLSTAQEDYAIGVTEGLISRLSRSELSAVVVQQGAHLVAGDTHLATIVSSLFGVFSDIARAIEGDGTNLANSDGRDGRAQLASAGIWLFASIGKVLTMAVSTSILREKEFAADAHAVRMCKDPLALATALRKISGRYRGAEDVPDIYAPLFIVNPKPSLFDENDPFFARWFGTHPPIRERMERLMKWAHADLEGLPPEQAAAFVGGGGHISRAGDPSSFFFSGGAVAEKGCPICNAALVDRSYEGTSLLHCPSCFGYLLESGDLIKILTRREETFSSAQVREAKIWRGRQKTFILPGSPTIPCAKCSSPMTKCMHSYFTKIVFDKCGACGAIWLEEVDLDRLQILTEAAKKTR